MILCFLQDVGPSASLIRSHHTRVHFWTTLGLFAFRPDLGFNPFALGFLPLICVHWVRCGLQAPALESRVAHWCGTYNAS